MEVVFDGARTDEQPLADLGVGQAVAGEPGDLGLLGGEVLARLDGALTGALAGRRELALGTRGEGLDTHPDEHLVGGAQLFARVEAPALAAQPLAEEQMGTRELYAHARALKPLDRLPIEAVGGLAVAQQRSRTGFGPGRPLGTRSSGHRRKPLER